MNLELPKRRVVLAAAWTAALAGCATPRPVHDNATLVQAVTAAEIAFARTMADRDFEGFLRFVSEEAVFLNGGSVLTGRPAIGAFWKKFYEGPMPPFSWKPDVVMVLASGQLAESGGPVTGSTGRLMARFRSTWRLEADGQWRVVFDNGTPVCDCNRTAVGSE